MLQNEINDKKIKINRGRYNLIFIVLTSVINIFTITSGSTLVLPYSSSISNYAIAFSTDGDDALRIMGLILACSVLLLLLICYLLSKEKPVYIIIATVVMVADTISLIVISIASNSLGNLFVLLDIFIHILVVAQLTIAIIAYSSLRALQRDLCANNDTEQDFTKQSDVPTETDVTSWDTYSENEDDLEESDDESDDITKPIREYADDGTEPLVSGTVNGLNVFAIIRSGTAELVINGYVCDELNVAYMSEFQLRAIVNGIDFIFDYRRDYGGETMYLYANDELLDSLGRS